MPAAFDRCVKHVKGKGKVDNPYAVCRTSMGTDAQIKARHKGEYSSKKVASNVVKKLKGE